MPWVGLAGAAISAGASIYNSNKAAKTAKEAAKASQIDINALDEQTRAIAQRNAQESAALEQRMTPEVPALRTAANQGVLNGLQPDDATTAARLYLMSHMADQTASPAHSQLLNDAVAMAGQQLALGGELPLDVRNLVARTALARTGGVTGNLGLGRDVVARDLGLTSLDLMNSRLANAGTLGQMELGGNQFNSNLQLQNNNALMQRIAQLQSIGDSGFGRQLAAATYAQGIQQPIVGLDPSAVANVVSGNANNASRALSNQANIQGAQGNNYLQFAGNLFGGYINKFTTPSSPSTSSNSGVNPYPLAQQNPQFMQGASAFKF